MPRVEIGLQQALRKAAKCNALQNRAFEQKYKALEKIAAERANAVGDDLSEVQSSGQKSANTRLPLGPSASQRIGISATLAEGVSA